MPQFKRWGTANNFGSPTHFYTVWCRDTQFGTVTRAGGRYFLGVIHTGDRLIFLPPFNASVGILVEQRPLLRPCHYSEVGCTKSITISHPMVA